MPAYTSIAQEFEALELRRAAKLLRAREAASLTIPGLFPEAGFTQTQELPVPYSSAAARGVSNLASKWTSATLPLNTVPFMQLDLNVEPVEGEDPTKANEQLAAIERLVMDQLLSSNLRSALYLAAQHLAVVGDCMVQMGDDFTFRVHRLDQYVVRRTPDGVVRQIILREWVDTYLLPLELAALNGGQPHHTVGCASPDLEPLYTKIEYDIQTTGWKVSKEFRGSIYEKDKTYDISPYMPLRWADVSGEDYGRSLCEENIGDLRSLESLSKSLIEGAAANAEFRFGVNPSGITNIKHLEDSSNGDFVPAVEGDVFPIQLQNMAQVEITARAKADLERAIGRVFLVDSLVQPQGERVTTYQARIFASELDAGLNGNFSAMSRDLQLPIVRRSLHLLERKGLIPTQFMSLIQNNWVNIKIRTGLEALSREVEGAKLEGIVEKVLRMPPEAQETIKWPGFVRTLFTAAGVDPSGIVNTEEEQAQMLEARQRSQIESVAAQQAIKSAGSIAENQAAMKQAA